MSKPNIIICELLVESYEKVRFRRSDTGQVTGILNLARFSRQIMRFENLLRANQLKSRQDFAKLGTLLYRCLFNGAVENSFKQIIKEIEDSKNNKNPKIFRIQLTFSEEVSDLAGIPWEFIYYPDSETVEGFFLIDYSNLVISRYLPLEKEIHSMRNEEDLLRFLIVISEPAGLGEILKDSVIEKIQDLQNYYPGISLDILEKHSRRQIQEKIAIRKPHIFHYIGHGRFNWQDQKGEIALLNSDLQTPIWISDDTFADYFKDFKPSLVVLQACQGGEGDFTANYAGLAPKLARKGIPAVIAMQYPVTNKIANVFSLAFYQALAKGESVDTAVQQGRREIVYDSDEYYDNRDFGNPVLYMSARDGYIIPRLKTKIFDAEDLRNSPSELEKAMNTLFNSEELANLEQFDDLVFSLRMSYEELPGETPQEKIKALIAYLQKNGDIGSLINAIKHLKPESFKDK
ncbi:MULTISPECIES: CHAT domain-containing protein [Nostoc]|uniref:CHAT domain-containing protein n=1 Tax=Nostoc paludosum FACHB-159 TaxID=2692908 RepID=A0ABR8KGN7_9NOSO|nr:MULTISPECIES: CHAT domain-containing protein [Nostoc]MBD2681568.1 CHAT domain-containing protein [Nostoc sp. FACHB-857]MBD2738029.1 CHAT domain-containing protein [Nostoc paludosum FACHB-159]